MIDSAQTLFTLEWINVQLLWKHQTFTNLPKLGKC